MVFKHRTFPKYLQYSRSIERRELVADRSQTSRRRHCREVCNLPATCR